MDLKRREPYRLHFFLGTICAIFGALLWPAMEYLGTGYPVVMHGQLMLLGFLFSFVCGFLMTAAPKMSGTPPASAIEIYLALGLALLNIAAALSASPRLCFLFGFAQLAWLARFLIARFLRRSQNPPLGFAFVAVGLVWGLWGALSSALALEGSAARFARIGLQEAMILNLIVGLGSRLIPFLSRTRQVQPFQTARSGTAPILLVLISLNLTFVLEASLAEPWRFVWAARGLVLLAAAHFLFDVFKPSMEKAVIGFGIRLSVACLIAGYALVSLFPVERIAYMHFVFIGGFGLLTFMIATRVLLAHGGFGLGVEVRSRALLACALLIVLAAILRAEAWWTWAALVWSVALVIWMSRLAREGVRP